MSARNTVKSRYKGIERRFGMERRDGLDRRDLVRFNALGDRRVAAPRRKEELSWDAI